MTKGHFLSNIHSFIIQHAFIYLGNLEPSRAFGDALLKDKLFNRYLQPEYQMTQPFTPPYITATPEVIIHRLQRGDEFLILATDGLWDRVSNQEAVDIVANRLVGFSLVFTFSG